MTNTSLNIAKEIDPVTSEVLGLIAQTSDELGIRFVVIGATARDLVMHYCFGAEIQRATRDVDFAVQVESWSAFGALITALEEKGCKRTKTPHRMEGPNGGVVDIVPFGQLESSSSTIIWPPPGESEMTVLGMSEALESAVLIEISSQNITGVPVATPAGLMILKLVSWTERTPSDRVKDARDILYLLRTYESLPSVNDEYFNDEGLTARSDWDLTLGAAELLGRHARVVSATETSKYLTSLFDRGIRNLSVELLVQESCSHHDNQFDRHNLLLEAFISGFRKNTTSIS